MAIPFLSNISGKSATFAGTLSVGGGDSSTAQVALKGQQSLLSFVRGTSGDAQFFMSSDSARLYFSHTDIQSTNLILTLNQDKSATFAGTIDSGSITSTGIVKAATTFQSTAGSMTFFVPNVGQALEIAQNTGNATFAGDVRLPNSGKLFLWNDHDSNYLMYDRWRASASAGMNIQNVASDGEIFLRSGNALALTLDGSQNATFAGNILMGNTVVNPASGFADQTGIGLKYSTTVPEIQVSSDDTALQLGRTSTGGNGIIMAMRYASNTIHTFSTNAASIGTDATFAGRVSAGGASNPTGGAKLHVADGTGAGLEVIPSTTNDKVTLLSYDRSATAYQSLNFEALDFSFLNGDVYIGTASGNGKLDVHATNGRWRVNNYGGMYFRNDSNSTHESYIHPRSDGSLSIGRVAESNWSQTGSGAFASTTYDHLTFDTSSNATFAAQLAVGGATPSAAITLADHTTAAGGIKFRTAASTVSLYSSGSGNLMCAADFNSAGRIRLPGGNAVADPDIGFSGATAGTGFSRAGQDITFIAGGAEKMRLKSNGNFGVGVSPETKFHVQASDSGGQKTVYGQVLIEQTDAQLDLLSTSSGTWGSAINFVEAAGSNANTDVWSIARKTTGGAGDSSLNFNFGTSNQHDNANKLQLASDGSATFANSIDLTAGQVKLRTDVALDHDGSSLYIKAPSAIYFYPGNTNKGNLSTAGTLTISGDLNAAGLNVGNFNTNIYLDTINSNTGGESWNASNGWHRIIEISGGSGRGKCHFLIQTGGGSGTPCRFEAIVNTAWSNANATLSILHSSYPNFITDIRVVRNSTSGKAFVDIKGGGEDYVDVTILPHGSTSAALVNFTNVNTLPTGDSKQIEKTITGMIMSLATGTGTNTSGQTPFQVKYDGSIITEKVEVTGGQIIMLAVCT